MLKSHIRLFIFILGVIALIICSIVLSVMYFIIYPTTITKGNGNITSEKRDLTKFVKLNVSDKINVNISQSNSSENLEISAEDNIIKNIKTEVSGDTLYISFARRTLGLTSIEPTKDVVINLNYLDLQEISLSGNVNLKSGNKVRVDKLTLNQSGSSTSSMELFTNSLKVNMSGVSVSNLTGSATTQDIQLSGSVTYSALDLDGKDLKVGMSGSGKASLRADESLDMNISGSASIEYGGNPKKLTQNNSGSGTVKQVNN